MATVGILGIGGLAGLLMRGLEGSGHRFALSPRNADLSAALARDFGAEVAPSNQAVVDAAEAILVCLPATTGADELASLTFRKGQTVLSAMAGTGLERLSQAVAPAAAFIGLMPGYANVYRQGPSILCPDDRFWCDFLSYIGPFHSFEDEATFTAAATFGAFSGAAVGFIVHVIRWFEAQGVPPDTALALVAGTMRGNAEVLLREPRPLDEIAKGMTTPGGITLQLLDILQKRGALTAWDEALDAVYQRISGKPGRGPA